MTGAVVVDLSGVSKQYGALRPLRIARLEVADRESVAVVGLDRPAAEMFISLVTGASLPDHGDVRVFGRSTRDISEATDWLSTLDRFGIVSDRAVLLEALSVAQNLALPFSLDLDPLAEDVRRRAIELAREVEIPEPLWTARVGDLTGGGRLRVRLGRALALDPSLLLVEHPTAAVESSEAPALAHTIRAVAARRRLAVVTLTTDRRFGGGVADRVLTLEPASGTLTAAKR